MLLPFLNQQTKGVLTIPQAFYIGLIKSRVDHVSVSPDAMAVLSCLWKRPLDWVERSQMDIDIIEFYDFSYLGEVVLVADVVNEDDEMESCSVMGCCDYKHRSESVTIQQPCHIVSNVLGGLRVQVIELSLDEEDEDNALFQVAIPNVDHRCQQVIYQAVVGRVNIAVYVAATTSVEFVLIILLLRHQVRAIYIAVTQFIRDHALNWLCNNKKCQGGPI